MTPTKAERKRMDDIKQMAVCMACRQSGAQSAYVEVHHLNAGGQAGQKRRGHRFTIGLCPWHHRGVPLAGHTAKAMHEMLGPPLTDSRKFRFWFGTDDELLAAQDKLLGSDHAD